MINNIIQKVRIYYYLIDHDNSFCDCTVELWYIFDSTKNFPN